MVSYLSLLEAKLLLRVFRSHTLLNKLIFLSRTITACSSLQMQAAPQTQNSCYKIFHTILLRLTTISHFRVITYHCNNIVTFRYQNCQDIFWYVT